ncbi:uncharacterized protein HHUB_2383 [Halobacterium hubeiense]|uniref:Uncharacterized protein n=1 Tax=Halobacterium hubeiense TaxID=1407499 RepID=A0A0U5H1Z2_9EURY|nr:uncharacterized protein HHUB_2383 [Halobacterium hubeiense]
MASHTADSREQSGDASLACSLRPTIPGACPLAGGGLGAGTSPRVW